jgi:glycosyltransferase involved in cell wall biosynthesis
MYSSFIGFFSHNTVSGFYKLTFHDIYDIIIQTIFMPVYILNQIKIIKKVDPDIIHLNATVLISSGFAAFFCRKPIVWHIREPLSDGYFGIRRKIISYLIKRLSKKVIAISPYDLSKLGKNKYNNMTVVYNFVDFEKFDSNKYIQNEEKMKLGFLSTSKLVVTLGGSSEVKGFKEIVLSQEYFTDKDDTYIVVVGAGKRTDIDHVVEASNSRFIDKTKIVMLGRRNDIPNILAASDVLVFGGTVPHFPRPIFEAWAMRKPIIAFNVEGVNNNVNSGIDGMLVDIDSQKLGYAINRILSDRNLSKKLCTNGFQKAKILFDKDKNMKQILEIYESI